MRVSEENYPLISVVITSYNRATFIAEAIDSALRQDYPNFEVVISDNASSDNTDEVVAAYRGDQRVQYFKNESNIGMLGNFKKATDVLARGKYISYISSDDYLINNSFLTEAYDIVKKHENVVAVFGQNQTYFTAKDEMKIELPESIFREECRSGIDVFKEVPREGCVGWGAAIFERELFLGLNPFDSDIISLDYEINFKLMMHGNIGFIKKPCYVFRVHGNQESRKFNADATINNLKYITNSAKYAESTGKITREEIKKWQADMLFNQAVYLSIRFLPVNKDAYKKLINYFSNNHPEVYKRLRKNIKWNILSFFFSRPALSLPLFKVFSKAHFEYLSSIVNKTG